MKFLNLLAIFTLVITGCSKNDDEDVAPAPVATPVGTYKLTAFNVSTAQDLNGDGTSSVNQMNESICLNNSFLVLNADNTFAYNDKGIEITSDGVTDEITCYNDGNITGTWSINGSVLTLNSNGTMETYTYTGNTISITVPDSDVVGMSGGNPVYVTADLSVIYTKQ